MKLIGLTGGIATGKSTVAQVLRDLGVSVIDADAAAREVVAPGTEGLQQIINRFGREVCDGDGALDRGALGEIVMADPIAKADLESITHPLIRARVAQQVQARFAAHEPAVVVEAALLVETGAYALYDALWVVGCSRENQIDRLMRRKDCDRDTAIAWIDNQLPLAEKRRHATTVIENDGDLTALRDSVGEAWTSFMARPTDPG